MAQLHLAALAALLLCPAALDAKNTTAGTKPEEATTQAATQDWLDELLNTKTEAKNGTASTQEGFDAALQLANLPRPEPVPVREREAPGDNLNAGDYWPAGRTMAEVLAPKVAIGSGCYNFGDLDFSSNPQISFGR